MKPRYPVGDQSFASLRQGGYVYVDKTQYIEKLVGRSKYYFLGRPRRFGKSLFLSTLKCFFEGRRELFRGLHIDSMDWDWQPYPVLHLDFNPQKFKMPGELDDFMEVFISRHEESYGIRPTARDHSSRLSALIREMARQTGKNVVILVDEYDKPLVTNIHNPQLYQAHRDKLGTLYANFKSSADYIRMVFLTGVSRFGKLSVFSDLNNIRDISFSNEYAAICGITQQELLENFTSGIDTIARIKGKSFDQTLALLKERYDGYHFTNECVDIYNPYSLLCAFDENALGNYWIESGTPSLLVKQLKRSHSDLTALMHTECGEEDLKGLDIESIRPAALLYQTGYLTIKHYDPEYELYTLDIPNQEVNQGFFEYILPFYSNLEDVSTKSLISTLLKDLNEGKADKFMKRLQTFFAGITYEMKLDEEKNVHNALFILFSLLGLKTDVEYHTSDGRIDILIRTPRYIYILELQHNGSARDALEQIKEKDYSLAWAMDPRPIIAIGINYSSKKRRLDEWEISTLKPPT